MLCGYISAVGSPGIAPTPFGQTALVSSAGIFPLRIISQEGLLVTLEPRSKPQGMHSLPGSLCIPPESLRQLYFILLSAAPEP